MNNIHFNNNSDKDKVIKISEKYNIPFLEYFDAKIKYLKDDLEQRGKDQSLPPIIEYIDAKTEYLYDDLKQRGKEFSFENCHYIDRSQAINVKLFLLKQEIKKIQKTYIDRRQAIIGESIPPKQEIEKHEKNYKDRSLAIIEALNNTKMEIQNLQKQYVDIKKRYHKIPKATKNMVIVHNNSKPQEKRTRRTA
jgi:hypothetical protein